MNFTHSGMLAQSGVAISYRQSAVSQHSRCEYFGAAFISGSKKGVTGRPSDLAFQLIANY
jgi:hypothetical protein